MHPPPFIAMLLGTALLAAPGRAQEATLLDPIVLRAGSEKVASSVPQSVTVIDAQALDDLAPGSIGDVLAQVPGVSNTGGAGFFGQGFNIRGFGATGTAASEAGIVQLIDGERKFYESYRQGSLFVEPDFLRRVEVLRGPGSSTLHGAGALGGVIAMETIDAADLIAEGRDSGGRVRLGYAGNPGTGFASLAWGWRNDRRFEAVTAFAYRRLGDTTDADGDTIVRSNSDTPNLLLKARQRIGDHRLEASYLHLEARGDDQDLNQLEGAQVGLFPGFPGWGVGDILTRDQTARLAWGYAPADNPLIDATVTLSYTNTIKDIRQGSDPSEPISESLLGRRDYGLWKLRAENRADLSGAGLGQVLTLGAEISEQDRTSSVASSAHPEAFTRQAAVYALSEMDLGALTLTMGLRHTRQKTEPKSSVTATDDRLSADVFEPQIAALYRLDDRWSVFGSAALVKRVPTVDELYDSFMGGAPSPDLTEETGRNLEAGISYAGGDVLVAGDDLSVKLTVFRNHIDDRIERTNAPFPTPAYVNIDRASLRGGEIEASYAVGAWTLGAAVAVVEGEDQDGGDLNSLPNNRLVMDVAWQATPALRLGARSTLAAGRDKPDGSRRAGYGVQDVFATVSPRSGPAKGTDISLGIDNLFDRDHVPATWLTGPAPGRNVKLTVTRRF